MILWMWKKKKLFIKYGIKCTRDPRVTGVMVRCEVMAGTDAGCFLALLGSPGSHTPSERGFLFLDSS